MMITLAAITKVSQWPRLFSEQTVSLQTVGMRLQKSERMVSLVLHGIASARKELRMSWFVFILLLLYIIAVIIFYF